MRSNMSCEKWRPFCPGGDELNSLVVEQIFVSKGCPWISQFGLLLKKTGVRHWALFTDKSLGMNIFAVRYASKSKPPALPVGPEAFWETGSITDMLLVSF